MNHHDSDIFQKNGAAILRTNFGKIQDWNNFVRKAEFPIDESMKNELPLAWNNQ